MEDEDNNIHLKNLSVHPANNEEEALNLLFLGDTNRMIAEASLFVNITSSFLSKQYNIFKEIKYIYSQIVTINFKKYIFW